MKYILLMSGTRAGVEAYHAWPKQDIEAHMAVLHRINQESLTESGEFVATQGLAEPKEAKVVRGEKNGVPVTDGIFPESKEFLLGYWIVNVATPERAYAIAARISAAYPATNMPIEVRKFAFFEATEDRMTSEFNRFGKLAKSRESSANEIKGKEKMKYVIMMNTMRAGHGVPEWPKKTSRHISHL